MTRNLDAPRWAPAVRLSALQIRREQGMGLSETRRELKRAHGADVPLSTLRAWFLASDASDVTPTVDGTATRLLRLCAEEVTRQERSPQSKRDLQRLAQCAQILKTVEPLTKTKTKTARTLSDLNPSTIDGSETPETKESHERSE